MTICCSLLDKLVEVCPSVDYLLQLLDKLLVFFLNVDYLLQFAFLTNYWKFIPTLTFCCSLLDKLLVVCPNVDYCEEVLPRCELEAHLLHRCRGAVTKCIKSTLGCTFQGPRSALQSHLWECQFRDQDGGQSKLNTQALKMKSKGEMLQAHVLLIVV